MVLEKFGQKTGSRIWIAKKSGLVGRPTDPDLSQYDKKEAKKIWIR
jgi:hypothetical protein